jgi:hypothetical protein
MALQQGQTLSFRSDIVQGGQNLSTDTLKMALYTGFATLGPTTTEYVTDNELPTENGYTAGGVVMTGVTIATDVTTNTVYINFSNVSWPGAAFIARGALIYNSSKSNKSVAVLDFGSDKIFTSVSNTVIMPFNSASTALLRFV